MSLYLLSPSSSQCKTFLAFVFYRLAWNTTSRKHPSGSRSISIRLWWSTTIRTTQFVRPPTTTAKLVSRRPMSLATGVWSSEETRERVARKERWIITLIPSKPCVLQSHVSNNDWQGEKCRVNYCKACCWTSGSLSQKINPMYDTAGFCS